MRAGTGFRPDIEGLRALAIGLVLAFHFAPRALPGGFLGVDLFFVISGYLITLSLLEMQGSQRRADLAAFWARRARRLLPNALLVLMAVAVAAAWGLPDAAAARVGSEVGWAGAYAVNWLFVARAVDYLRWGDSEGSVLLNYWSLAVEEQFYLAWPLLLLALRPWGRGAIFALAAILALLSLGALLLVSRDSLTLAFFSTPLRAWELLAGALLALQRGRWLRCVPTWMGALGLLALLSLALGWRQEFRHPGLWTLLPVVVALLLLQGVSQESRLGQWLASAPARAVGARSYSIYLWHWPVLMLGEAAWPEGGAVGRLVWLLLGLALAEAAYRGVEQPCRFRWAQGRSPRWLLLRAALASLLVMAAGQGLRWSAEQGLRPLAASHRPAGLPALAQTLADLPPSYANGCHLGVEPEAPRLDCRFGAGERGLVLLWGDSHAAQWLPALVPAAGERGLSVLNWTKSSCPFPDVLVWNPGSQGPYRECDRWREAAWRELGRLRPTLVVLASYDDPELVLVQRDSSRLLHAVEAQTEFERGWRRSLERLRAMGITAVLLRDNPVPRRRLMDCLYGQPDPRTCERTLGEARAVSSAEWRAAQAFGLPVWDLAADICPDGHCPVVVAGRSVYRDDHHLSASFAARLAAPLAQHWPVAAPTR